MWMGGERKARHHPPLAWPGRQASFTGSGELPTAPRMEPGAAVRAGATDVLTWRVDPPAPPAEPGVVDVILPQRVEGSVYVYVQNP